MATPGRERQRRAARLALVGLAAVAALASPSTALADGAAITVTTVDGRADPVAFVPRIFTVSGTSTGAKYLFVKHRAAGGSACAPSAYSDPGSSWTGFYNLPINGGFAFPKAVTWDAVGAWMFCFWLAGDERGIVFPTTQSVSFRSPLGTMGGSVSPAVPRPNQRATLTLNGTSEAPRNLYAKVRSASTGPCATTYDIDAGQSLISGESVDGGFTGRAVTVQRTPGQYLICAWLAGSTDDPLPIVVQPVTFTVKAIPPKLVSARPINCSTRATIRRFRAADIRSLCVRYRFTTTPYAGQRLLISYVTPERMTYKTVTARWPSGDAKSIIAPGLAARAYKHRPGTWHAILRMAGKRVTSTAFRVM